MKKETDFPYEDLINRVYEGSTRGRRMSREKRAAQFAPFAALTGYEDAVEETARMTDRETELSESERNELDRKLAAIIAEISKRPEITGTRFVPDERKDGGSYRGFSGRVRRLDPVSRMLILESGEKIALDHIRRLERVGSDGNR